MSFVLGIETSCDETGIAIVEDGRRIVSSALASQVPVHAPFGGVVPEIASRRHTQCIFQLAQQCIEEAGVPVDAVAVTIGPGLMGSLMVGVGFAKGLAYAWGVPIIPVHHIEGHIFSVFLTDNPPTFPFLALVVSGGHTCLIACDEPHRYRLLGSTRDDAVGESFDKVARLLDLPYPGGPSIQKAAEQGNPRAIRFPRGLERSGELEFSYSGLKTAVLYERQRQASAIPDIAASFQWAAVDVLITKTKLAIEKTGAERLVLAGGVAANRLLRERLVAELPAPVHMPPMSLCIDNGAMIAAAGDSRLHKGLLGHFRATPDPNLPLCVRDER
ncbi:MAG TPA: tRNA (adenosine(37)-N6)-threonylcarbamoyltransferase complex transferase subunit TsaD [Candidatus Hydrogenedentes bacterium]|nr:tRNA (adenosine(37)-N6)-threonylcarbamoyltransferase complex transferase subunit TsaD [Candidatus Hydrogenedentota bacterium]HRT20140.1 tRNA (adenosine(37)-N6)-threonylcarbamoyltransferase complex transferase subunit TsaD [Candidatus Hydrogenedentota bacterium]HRT66687.1 tRNA (adenosine(37)-N6)-threonylcarbamoyltransferase complex transferase subunit TsaD [Candidatus Hydrogenedentota bacterium]